MRWLSELLVIVLCCIFSVRHSNIAPVIEKVAEKNAAAQKEHQEPGEEELLAVTQAAAGHRLEDHVYVDMDHDGSRELIGVFAIDGYYQTWYCSSEGEVSHLVHQNDAVMDTCVIEILAFQDETHVVLNACSLIGTQKNYTILALQDNEISCLASNQYGYVRMTKEGDVILDVEAYDGMYTPDFGMSTHTWKDIYLYFDGETYREYGAKEITEEEFAGFTNAQTLKEAIADELWQPDTEELEYSYFKRKNNILHIQCNVYSSSGTIQFGYYTVRFSGDVLQEQIGEYTAGIMAPSFSDWDVTY